MLIILEGTDGVGKSTLADTLSKLLDADIIHCTTKTANDYNFFKDILNLSKKSNVIADRFCYGQFVYQADGERPLGTLKDLHKLELEMAFGYDVKLIHVTASDETIKSRMKQRDEFEEDINAALKNKIHFEYLFLTGTILTPVVVDTTGGNSWVISK